MAKKLEELLQEYGNPKISDADMALGRNNYGALEGILQARQDWSNATTQEEKTAAHNKAETLRKLYGSYSGGADGMSGTYSPTYTKPSKAAENSNVDALFEKFNNVYKNPAPTWTPQYEEQIQGILSDISNRKGFEYDMNKDAMYQQYRDSYIREGKRAMQDSAAQAAALTGGYGSTYGAIAAQQGYDNYLAGLNDIVPQLEQRAYGRYMDDVADKYNQLGAYQTEENRLYGQYMDALGQYNTDRSFAYGAMQDAISQSNYENEFDRGNYENDRNYAYQRAQDALQQENYRKEYDRAVLESDRAYQEAQKQAAIDNALAIGDYSYLEENGYDTSYLNFLKSVQEAEANLGLAQQRASLARATSGGGGGGGSKSSSKPALTYAQTMEAIDEGRMTPNVLAAYEYYMGEAYQTEKESESEADKTGKGSIGFTALAMNYKMMGDTEAFAETAADLIQKGTVTQEEYKRFLKEKDKYGDGKVKVSGWGGSF